MRGREDGGRHQPGNGGNGLGPSDDPDSLAHLRAEIAALRVLKAETGEDAYEIEINRIAKRFRIAKGKIRAWVDQQDKTEPDDGNGNPLPIDDPAALVAGLKPNLVIDRADLPAAAYKIRDALAKAGGRYERGAPVRVVQCADGGPPEVVLDTIESIVRSAHKIFRVVVERRERRTTWLQPVTLFDRVARQYLDMRGEWNLPPLKGFSSGPILTDDGGIRAADGYDRASGLYCANLPAVSVPPRPSRAEAEAALHTLRRLFRTFPFGDSPLRRERITDSTGDPIDVEVVDLDQPPGRDESTLLIALLGAVCRANLPRAPALMVNAAQLSGSGAGKGLLLRGVSYIAFGVEPMRFTSGTGGSKLNREELEKRLSAALLAGHPFVVLDNLNNTVLWSETLESALTEVPCHARQFGTLKMPPFFSQTLIGITGNGLTAGRDMIRRSVVRHSTRGSRWRHCAGFRLPMRLGSSSFARSAPSC
jgi:hypothetical protein